MTKKTGRTAKTTSTNLSVVKTAKEEIASQAKCSSTACFAPFVTLMPLNQKLEETMAKNTQQFEQFTQDAVSAGREYFEAFTKSYGIFAKGYEGLVRTSIELSQSTAEKQAAFAKEALSCKTLNEFAEVQNKIAQANFEDFMSGVTKISELSSKVLTESAEPLNEQINKAVEKVNKAA